MEGFHGYAHPMLLPVKGPVSISETYNIAQVFSGHTDESICLCRPRASSKHPLNLCHPGVSGVCLKSIEKQKFAPCCMQQCQLKVILVQGVPPRGSFSGAPISLAFCFLVSPCVLAPTAGYFFCPLLVSSAWKSDATFRGVSMTR